MLIAGNWKMNKDRRQAVELALGVVSKVGDPGPVDVAVCPPSVCLEAVWDVVRDTPVRLGGQNMHEADAGAFTGEVSAGMLKSVGCHYVILGHSERRQYFGETDEGVNRKVLQAIQFGLVPIVCVGETLEERDAGREKSVVSAQVQAALDYVTVGGASELVVAYEPVWAIGTGRTASPEQAQAMHSVIRGLLVEKYGSATGSAVFILYGGSMKPDNAAELIALPDVNGGLIGGASLKADLFSEIVDAARSAA